MKTLPCLCAVLGLAGVTAHAQSIAVQRLNAMNERAALASAAAAEQAAAARRSLEAAWGPIGPWYSDLHWQQATNIIGKLRAGMERNQKELELQKLTLQATSTAATSNRVALLRTYLSNQEKALSNSFVLKRAVEAKYKLQELKAQPQPR